jgi:hypothetical protein
MSISILKVHCKNITFKNIIFDHVSKFLRPINNNYAIIFNSFANLCNMFGIGSPSRTRIWI